MIYVLSGSTSLYAVIAVTYPSGSICTCGGKKAKDTSGFALFNVKPGTYKVECRTSDNSKSKITSVTVAESDKGKSKNVTLSYELVLFDGGDVSDITGGWESSGSGGSASVGTTISMSVTDDTGYAKVRTLTTKNSIDLTGFSSLVASIKSVSGDGTMKAGDSASVTISKTGNVSLDISGISNKRKISFEIGAWNSSTSLQVDRVWLE